MKTPAWANVPSSAPSHHARAPPSAVTATMARKIGLGRTEWRAGLVTSRSYRTNNQPSIFR
jgi:hypothetical protein